MVNAATRPRLVLASASPRRSELLGGLGLAFVVRPSQTDETPRHGERAEALVERLARDKAMAIPPAPDELVVAADTVVVVDGDILGKPQDATDAARMLRRLSGRGHEVLSGVACADGASGTLASGIERSRVHFAPLDERAIAWYVSSGEPLDRAGAYAVQGRAALFVTAVEGSYVNVVGLPLRLVFRLAGELGHDLFAWLP
jgi:septum formation protein